MRIKVLITLLMVAILVGAVLAGNPWPKPTAATPAYPKMTLKFGSPWPPPPASLSAAAGWWQGEITKRSGGNITFENYWGGSLVTAAPGQLLSAVSKGVVSLAPAIPPYSPAQTPLIMLEIDVPFRPIDPGVMLEIKKQLFREMPELQAEQTRNNVKWLWWQPFDNYVMVSTKPIKTPEDFKGKRIITPGTFAPLWFEPLGGTRVWIPLPELYVGLERGLLDGALLEPGMIWSGRLHEVAKYFIDVNFGASAAIGMWMNLDTWKALPPEVQRLFLEVGEEAEKYHVALLKKIREERIFKDFRDAGLDMYTMPRPERLKWAEKMGDSVTAWAEDMEKKGFPGRRLMKRFLEIAEEKGHKWPFTWRPR